MTRVLNIISDLHLGNRGPYDTFAGGELLPKYLDRLAGDSTMVVNGDMMDFLLDDEPMTLDPAIAVRRATAILENPDLRALWTAWIAYLARGGTLYIRPGNHDVELVVPAVQARIREHFAQHGDRVHFLAPDDPYVVEVGGVRVVLAHGEVDDDWNRIDWNKAVQAPDQFTFPPGSRLVKALLNPAKRRGMRFADLLKPDLPGGGLATLAVDPWHMLGLVHQLEVAGMLRQYYKRTQGDSYRGMAAEHEPGLDVQPRAVLDDEDLIRLIEMLSGGDMGNHGFGSDLWLNVLRTGLSGFALAWRGLAEGPSDAFFAADPEVEEWKLAQELGSTYRSSIVILGHTHAARFGHFNNTTLINTGTWIPLMQLPTVDAPLEEWKDLLTQLRDDPGLTGDARALVQHRFTAAEVRAEEGGALASLLGVTDDGVRTIARQSVRPPT